jgi:PAS domain S-box-containing protein
MSDSGSRSGSDAYLPPFIPTAAALALIGKCVLCLTDVVVITEAEPLDRPGPRIVFVNDAFEGQTGYRREEVIGMTPRLLQGPLSSRTEIRRMTAAFRKWESVRVEMLNYKKDGEIFCVEMDIVPIADERGRYTLGVRAA